MPWTRRALLLSAGSAALAAAVPARGGGGDRRLVVVLAQGGWDVSFALDPKPGSDGVDGPEAFGAGGVEEVRRYGGIDVAVNDARRPAVTRFFERWWDRTAVIRGVEVGTLSHPRSISRVLSGHWDEAWPDVAAVVGAADARRPLGAVDLSGFGRFGPYAGRCARWGRQGQARALLDPGAHFASPDLPDGGPWLAPDRAERAAVDAWLEGRADRLAARWAAGAEAVEAWRATRAAAVALRDDRPPLGSGIPWGWAASVSTGVDLVLDLLSRDLCRAVVVSSEQHWDTHARNEAQHGAWDRTFAALDALLAGLDAAGALERTTVLVVSEMTRTPRVNHQFGKDHWPWTSFLLCGGGVRGGIAVGGTDPLLRGQPVDLEGGAVDPSGRALQPAAVLASVAEIVGVDPGWAYPGVVPLRAVIG